MFVLGYNFKSLVKKGQRSLTTDIAIIEFEVRCLHYLFFTIYWHKFSKQLWWTFWQLKYCTTHGLIWHSNKLVGLKVNPFKKCITSWNSSHFLSVPKGNFLTDLSTTKSFNIVKLICNSICKTNGQKLRVTKMLPYLSFIFSSLFPCVLNIIRLKNTVGIFVDKHPTRLGSGHSPDMLH